MKIYTRKGDKGETRDGGGKVVLKCDCNIEAVGNIDELNAVLGMIKTEGLEDVQSDLLLIGALVSGIRNQESGIRNLERRVEFFEKEIDEMWEEMPTLKNFIIFGGTEKASLLFFARAVCRRAERSIVALKRKDLAPVIEYLNRLSDYLFCLGRYENFKAGLREKVWSG